ncbi:MAG: VanZ family protein [Elusimicrobiota bacterium]
MSSKKFNWILAIGYVFFIYATLNIARTPLAYLRAHGYLKLTLNTLFFLSALSMTTYLLWYKTREWWRYIFLFFTFYLYSYFSKFTQTPEELVHFFQYGLVGVLFLRALEKHDFNKPFSWVMAFFIASIAGIIDELLQGLLPNRHYDARDILLNVISVTLGLCSYFSLTATQTSKNQNSK